MAEEKARLVIEGSLSKIFGALSLGAENKEQLESTENKILDVGGSEPPLEPS